jgi:hypothetical protein
MSKVILITLKSGWRLAAEDGTVRRGRRRLRLELPPGASLRLLLPMAALETRRPWPAERELARRLRLVLPPELPMIETLLGVRSWEFIERAELPPLRAV